MRRIILVLVLLLSVVSNTTYANVINIDGVNRTYQLYVPSESPRGMVFVLHHLDGNAEQMKMLGFDYYAAQDNFLVVYPEAVQGKWNKDDLYFLKKLMDTLIVQYNINSKIYIVGASSGGMLAHGLAAQYSEYVSAIATVASTLPSGLPQPMEPVSTLMINGTNDPIIPFQGGNGFDPVTKAALFWIKANNCDLSSASGARDQIPSGDGTMINQESFRSPNGAEVIFYVIEGGGHSWPGGPIVPEAFFGKTCLHMNATKIIWDFFRSH